MNNIFTIILTIVAWQLICLIVDLITDDNFEKVGVFAFGIWIPVCFFVAFIIRKAKLWMSRKYNYYQLFGNLSGSNSRGGWLTNVYMTKAVADKYFIRQFEKDEEITSSYSIRLLREGKYFKSAPNKSDILTAEKIENGMQAFDAAFFERFRLEF